MIYFKCWHSSQYHVWLDEMVLTNKLLCDIESLYFFDSKIEEIKINELNKEPVNVVEPSAQK